MIPDSAARDGVSADPRPVISGLLAGRGLDRDGAVLIAQGLADGGVSDAQAAAFAMAVMFKGLDGPGRTALTLAMRGSGEVLRWDLPGPVVDKHSTGGVGDVVSLILAPVLAACGVYVPMISGRGLGHTGGTLDKLESIPGYRVDLEEAEFRRIVRDVGCAIVAASGKLASADRRLYAIRDEAACVASIDLITASILSKKLAAGLDALVLDVKSGSGAFMGEEDQAEALAQSLVSTANAAGCRTSALITDMDQPLARAAGNGLEVREAIACLRGDPSALREVTLALSAEALRLAGLDDVARRAANALDSGDAAEIFARMVAGQGGPVDLIDNVPAYLPDAPVIRLIPAPEGFVAGTDVAALGHAVIGLGGGRIRAGQAIDHRVGLSDLRRLAEPVEDCLGMVHARTEEDADAAIAAIQSAFRIADTPPTLRPPIRNYIAPTKIEAHIPAASTGGSDIE